jgi:hypothetical protein
MKANKRLAAKWLKDRINFICSGVKGRRKDGSIGPIHANTTLEIQRALHQRQDWAAIDQWKHKTFEDHWAGVSTRYFTAPHQIYVPENLVMVDVDCHNSGTLQGAEDFIQHLRNNYFPGLYFEPSTNGNGIHGYFVIKRVGAKPGKYNELLNRLQTWLRSLVSDGNFDIELVEIKGHCPIIYPEKDEEFKLGQLAKLPRDVSRFEEWKNTFCISFVELHELIDNQVVETPTTQPLTPTVRSVQSAAKSAGSNFSLDFTETTRLKEYKSLAAELLSGEILEANGGNRIVVTDDDYAIFLLILKIITDSMNEAAVAAPRSDGTLPKNADGSLPRNRFRAVWTELYSQGRVDRGFHLSRFIAIRDHLSGLGLIDWIDCRYRPDPKNHQGVAAKWKASEVLMGLCEGVISDGIGIEKEKRTSLCPAWNSSTQIVLRPTPDFGLGIDNQTDVEARLETLITPVEPIPEPIDPRDNYCGDDLLDNPIRAVVGSDSGDEPHPTNCFHRGGVRSSVSTTPQKPTRRSNSTSASSGFQGRSIEWFFEGLSPGANLETVATT